MSIYVGEDEFGRRGPIRYNGAIGTDLNQPETYSCCCEQEEPPGTICDDVPRPVTLEIKGVKAQKGCQRARCSVSPLSYYGWQVNSLNINKTWTFNQVFVTGFADTCVVSTDITDPGGVIPSPGIDITYYSEVVEKKKKFQCRTPFYNFTDLSDSFFRIRVWLRFDPFLDRFVVILVEVFGLGPESSVLIAENPGCTVIAGGYFGFLWSGKADNGETLINSAGNQPSNVGFDGRAVVSW